MISSVLHHFLRALDNGDDAQPLKTPLVSVEDTYL